MKKISFSLSVFISLLLLSLAFQVALAHEGVTAGNYALEVGWQNEPPIVGQRNAIVVNLNDTTNPDAEIDISGLTVEVSYGGQTKSLELQPLSEEAKNQYIAPILPTIPGKYTVKLGGMLGPTTVNASVEPEEVQAADAINFPNVQPNQPEQNASLGWQGWLSIAGFAAGLSGLVFGLLAFQKKR